MKYKLPPPCKGTSEYEEWRKSEKYEEIRRKMSEAQKKRYEDPEERRKNSEACKKRLPITEETRKKMSETQKKRYENPEEREKRRISSLGENNPFFGKHHTEETKDKIRNHKTGTKDSEETKEKKRIANLKRYEDPEERKRTGEATKKYCEDHPEYREIKRINQIRVFEENPGLRDIVSKTFKNKKQSAEHCRKKGLAIRGENNGCWKGGITRLDRQIRTSTKMKEWIRAVFERDDYRDWFSGCRGTHKNSMQAHHIIKFSELMVKYKITNLEEAEACEELWDVSNGVTMLRISHRAYHSMWG